ncbi:glucosamine-6-phosphate deaminase [Evansella vedderi]|uniref:Glucosamine-6-phosphate deaminase n=1 Tax=Evansella vedderi TaxID=38282 RepID=A0ABT9ZYP2_9BACI|nr:glucosamine-6-phosphate deaminase [Evansella vedderi]MDQ0256085.1 glucosamine-6-phosphate deaminase [Evansella vedderi]
MEVIGVKDFNEMSKRAAQFVYEDLVNRRIKVMGMATGGTPIGFYKQLVRLYKKGDFSFKGIQTVNLDEYVGLSPENPNSYHQYMYQHLFQHIDIQRDQTHLPNGAAEDLERECVRYEQLIEELGGIDLQLLGIGENGHIGFNEPGTSFHSNTHVVNLTTATREANARYFNDRREVPKQAITMGIDTIMKSKKILLLASGKEKAQAIYRLLYDKVDESCPATILQRHPNITIIADNEALSLVTITDRKLN